MTSLGEFLRARRAQLEPIDVGLIGYGRRRVPGLRREELAQLAGVSASYYARLEQGYVRGASPMVLDAIAGALCLGEDERDHLRRLAAADSRPRPPRRAAPERVTPATRHLLGQMSDVPAIVQGVRTDILAWNERGHRLLAGHLDTSTDRPNTARMVFLDPHTRDLYADWPRKARAIVGNLRLAVGRYPDDEPLASLIGELSMKSDEFAQLWTDHRIRQCDAADYVMRHPLIGMVTVTQQSLALVASPGQSLITFTAAAGSPSHHAIQLLDAELREK
ncbi:helix-turn-helix transcriptional regulator [Fodinicola acaciae]|uniref:helix-turn-helix transcriptional regulator n=1 Tax=Fodinicola acaciae TaxID=2681555 RepID=UPI001FECD709|nr:helix-turn-helix transcriptional regulator [Fodinicola acaciae]